MTLAVGFHVVTAAMRPKPGHQNRTRQTNPARKPEKPQKTASKCQTFVVVVRHGMTDWNLAGRVQGNMDESRLNDVGIRQAEKTGRLLRQIPFDKVFTSPLSRARQTCDLIAEASENPFLLDNAPRVLDGLTEIQFPWQGSLRNEIRTGPWAEHYTSFKRDPRTFSFDGFNPVRDIERRANHVWQTMRADEKRNGCHLLIGHNQTNKVLLATALQLPADLYAWNQGNCCINVIALQPGQAPTLRLCNSFVPIAGTPFRRSRRRPGTMRLILHQGTNTKRLQRELDLNEATHVYTIGKEGENALHNDSVSAILTSTSAPTPPVQHETIVSERGSRSDKKLYDDVLAILSRISGQHGNGTVALSMSSGRMVSAFVSACFRLGASGLQKFRSDPGGVTILDVKTVRHFAITPVRVECFNVPPEETDENLLQYTLPFDISDANSGSVI